MQCHNTSRVQDADKGIILPFQAKYCFIAIVVLLECAYFVSNYVWKSKSKVEYNRWNYFGPTVGYL